MSATWGVTPKNVTPRPAAVAHEKCMAILRELDWLERMVACDTLWSNDEFCFSCGKEKHGGECCEICEE